ncbi:MAG: glycosyltransferase family 39 protein, partial [Pirellulales bacterium]|nr:glycosyltransferase family 39 protein [Pirellulales bacterium]
NWLGRESLSADPDTYRAIAETLADRGVFGLTTADGQVRPTAFRPPLYPYLLSWITTDRTLGNLAVAVLHCLLGGLSVVCTFMASRRLLGEDCPVVNSAAAAALVAMDPILLQQSRLVMTETLATALASIVLWCWASHQPWRSVGWAAVLGMVLALAYLCRPTFLVWAGLMGLMMPWAGKCWAGKRWAGRREPTCGDPGPKRWGPAGLVLGIVFLTVAAWTLRNQRVLGHPVWATTHGGYTLLLGNNPSFYQYLEDGEFGRAWDPQPFFQAYAHRYDGDPNTAEFWQADWTGLAQTKPATSEYHDDRVAYQAARATMERQPRAFLWSCLVRMGRLWAPLPHQTPGRWKVAVLATGVYYSLFFVAMLIGLRRLGRSVLGSQWWSVWTLVIALTLVHAIYWSNMRMRAPVIPGLAIIAAAAVGRRPSQSLPAT